MRIALALAALIALPAAASPANDVSKLQWLVGRWSETKGTVTTTETWRTVGGALAGTGETLIKGKPPHTEHMKISVGPKGLTFTAMIPGQPPTPFVLKPGSDGEALFENSGHDFPQRVIYRRCGPDLCARIEGTLQGKAQYQDWRYARVR